MRTYYNSLLVALGFTGLGFLMSGYLSYRNYFLSGCSQGPLSSLVTCGGAKAVHIFGQPTCIYGFAVFLIAFIVALVGLNRSPMRSLVWSLVVLSIAGTLFSGYLSFYEEIIQHLGFSPIPACIFGLVFFGGALIASIVAWRSTSKLATLTPAM